MRPPQKNVPSQAPSRRTPYMPGAQQDVRQLQQIMEPHRPGVQAGNDGYVISTYDARPINAYDWKTESGTDARDTGFTPLGGTSGPAGNSYVAASVFFTVPQGYQAILKNWHAIVVPRNGQSAVAGSPIFAPNGESNVRLTYSILVDGNFQPGYSSIVTWGAAFGDIFGECYVLANSGQTIEFRLLGEDDALDTSFYQALISLYGQLLLSNTEQLSSAAATRAIIPVAEQGQT